MSLITSCPACGTMFRVVPDQLKISEGWVRCGHCAEVFDATAHLADRLPGGPPADDPITEPAGLEPPPPVATAHPPPVPVAWPAAGTPGDPGFWDFSPAPQRRRLEDAPDFAAAVPAPPAAAPAVTPGPVAAGPVTTTDTRMQRPLTRPPWPPRTPVPAPAATAAPDVAPLLVDEPVPPVPLAVASPVAAKAAQPVVAVPVTGAAVSAAAEAVEARAAAAAGTPSRPVMLQGDDAEADANLAEVSFVRQARRRAFWRSPAMRMLLSLLALVLAAVLALQAAYQDRDRLALVQPALKPALERMCELLACRLAPPRQIEAIVIESSGFNRLRSDTYRLSFSLRNTAGVDIAVPAIELTLTDMQDQPVLRRVLTAGELGAAQPVIPAASEWTGAVGLTVQVGAARIAGYRLLAFYP